LIVGNGREPNPDDPLSLSLSLLLVSTTQLEYDNVFTSMFGHFLSFFFSDPPVIYEKKRTSFE
jgi:hypothetical protein